MKKLPSVFQLVLCLAVILITSASCSAIWFDEENPADEPTTKSTDEPTEATPAETTDPETDAISLDLKVSGNIAILSAERDFTKAITDAAAYKRKARTAAKPLVAVQREIQTLQIQMQQAQGQLIGLNTQLANVSDVATNNRLVGAINTLEGQLNLAQQNLTGLKEAENKVRADLNVARETYVEQVLSLRRQADALAAAYESAGDEAEVAAQLEKLMADTGKQLKFSKSPSFDSSIRKLEELEQSIRTEKVPLRSESNTFFASVVINGKHTTEMVVDSGASLISLPYKMAVEFGIEPRPGDKQILITIADGSQITGHLKKLDSVRVGTFIVEDVECAILGPEAVNAEPLLGMTFLGEFQFELDSAAATLGLTEIDGQPAQSKSRK